MTIAALAKIAYNSCRNRHCPKCQSLGKPPFGSPEQVLAYLARYIHRIAITNSRLVRLEGEEVTFTWKDYADHDRLPEMTLSG